MDYYFRMLENESELNARYDYVQEANFGMTECQANLDAEAAYYEAEASIATQDAMEARGLKRGGAGWTPMSACR